LIFLLDKWKISSGEHKGEKFSLHDAPYLIGLAQDQHPFRVTMKSAQSRISELELARTMWKAISRKGNLLYTFPAAEQMQQFVDARAREAVLNNEFLQKYITGSLNLKKFSINKNQIYWRGVQKRRQIITVDVSDLEADEVDEYEEGTLYTLDKRLGASANPQRSYFSTPKFHGSGISLYYYGNEAQNERGSDQRVWTIQCESCGQWNEDLIWEHNILDKNAHEIKFSYYQPDIIIICRFCKKPLDRLSARAQWVVKFPKNSDYCHGYSISKLFAPNANLNQMMKDSMNPLKEQEFNNSDLGRPYEPKGSRIADENLDAIRGNYTLWLRSEIPCFIGADIGNVIHAAASIFDENNRVKIVSVIELNDWEELGLFYKDFRCKSIVIDANPDKDEAIKFQNEHSNVWLAYYPQFLERSTDKVRLDWDSNIVNIHRTLMMMTLSDVVMNKKMTLPIDIRRIRDFYEHMKSPIRALKQDVIGNWVPWYPNIKNPDHYFHALVYNLTAMMLNPQPAIFRKLRTLIR